MRQASRQQLEEEDAERIHVGSDVAREALLALGVRSETDRGASSLEYATFVGSSGSDTAHAIAIDATGAVTIAGWTNGAGFPTTPGAHDTTYAGSSDVFVTRLARTGASLDYSSLLRGSSSEFATGLVLDARAAATVVGYTNSADFPTTPGAFDRTLGGFSDGFITRLDMLPTGVAAFGRSSPGCDGPLAVTVTSVPSVGNASFALSCSNAPANTADCVVALAAAGLTIPMPLLGVEIWFDPSSAWLVAHEARSDAFGVATSALPIPNHAALIGQRLVAQFVWAGPSAPPPCPPLSLSASHALAITIQP